MDAPVGPAREGTVFMTTGTIPMSSRHWQDRSTVTVADRPSTFEFVTEARAGAGPSAMVARYRHRYEMAPADGGSSVTYTMTQEQVVHPLLRLGLPVIRQIMWAFGIPMFAGRGFRNLLAESEVAVATASRAG